MARTSVLIHRTAKDDIPQTKRLLAATVPPASAADFSQEEAPYRVAIFEDGSRWRISEDGCAWPI